MGREIFLQKKKNILQRKNNELSWITLSVILVFVVRFFVSFLPSFGFDMGTWFGWAGRLSSLGLANFYSESDWTQYTPGFLYWLWFIGKLGWINEWAIKIPVNIADIILGLIIWSLVRKTNKKLAIASFFLYTLNPVVLFDGPVWGQIDGLLTLFLFLSAYFLIEKESFVGSVFFWSIAFLIKPQSIAIAPAIFISIFVKKFNWKEILKGGFVGIATILLLSWPFFVKNPFFGLINWIIKMGDYYSYTSVFAFNIWSWVGFWKPDTNLFLGIPLSNWGIILAGSATALALYIFRKKLHIKGNYYLLFAILSLCFFVFPTKVHERYVFPFFAFLLTAASLLKSRKLFAIYTIATVASFLNFYYPYTYYNKNFLFSQLLYNFSESTAKLVGLVFLGIYFATLFVEKLPSIDIWRINIRSPKKETKLPDVRMSERSKNYLLILVLIFAFATRIFNLGNPDTMYFDEVYHAFTAKAIIGGDIKAWEWWNTPPTGFAYEWTHPPLAKLAMVLGMFIFGENAFGWRIVQAMLGAVTVFLIYLLSKEFFKDKLLGILAAAVFSLDGLPLVMSRIGMNDSYVLFFALLTILLFLKRKNFLSALFFGFALASKWSAVWAIPILFLIWLKRRNKFEILPFLYFATIPFAVYIASYLPMFLTGHDLSTWWEMQKQMWWYHTNLRATHPYTSPWWSWPFLIRPIYLYTSEEVGGLVSRIYALGNPLVFWSGLIAVVVSFIYSLIERNRKLGLIVFSYLIFFVPWAASPRIMFLYHYLPSIPFMAITLAYVLRRNPKLIPYFLVPSIVFFIYFYPHWAGISVPVWLDASYYWMPTWR